MHTRRSFLAFAAAAQVIAPLARAMSVRDCRPIVARLPGVMLQTHAGRDVYFCNDLVSGRLAILNLQYDDCARLCLPPPRPGPDVNAYLYSLTLQRAIGSPADLRRYMEAYGASGAWPFAVPEAFELVRLRWGMCAGA